MRTIPTYSSPKMQDEVVQNLNALLSSYVEYLYGIARVGEGDDGLTYPQIYYNDGSEKNMMLFPDNRVKSFGFWEFRGADMLNDDEGVIYSLSFVFWGNLYRINPSKHYDFTSEIEQNIIKVLVGQNAENISYTEDGIFDIYSKYSEKERQTLMRPNTAFKIDFDIHGFLC